VVTEDGDATAHEEEEDDEEEKDNEEEDDEDDAEEDENEEEAEEGKGEACWRAVNHSAAARTMTAAQSFSGNPNLPLLMAGMATLLKWRASAASRHEVTQEASSRAKG
jgi:hypothetical protein